MNEVHRHTRRRLLVAAAGALAWATPAAQAQQYPTRPVRIIIGFAPGGPTDVIARLIAAELTTRFGQSVVVENRPGANSMIATDQLMRAAPDGYTLIATTLAHNINRILSPENAKYDPIKDFAPISLVATVPMIAVTGFNSPINNIMDLVAQAKAKPGQINYGSAGHGGSAHLAGSALPRPRRHAARGHREAVRRGEGYRRPACVSGALARSGRGTGRIHPRSAGGLA